MVFVVMILAAVVGVQVSTQQGAQAASCPTGPRFCTWWDVQSGGALYYYTGPLDGTCIDIGAPWDNNISSVKNQFQFHKVTLYGNDGCSTSGGANTIGPNKGYNLIPPVCCNDWASSMRIYPA
jgi:hypothetical protein